jgi:hypothetical protein
VVTRFVGVLLGIVLLPWMARYVEQAALFVNHSLN